MKNIGGFGYSIILMDERLEFSIGWAIVDQFYVNRVSGYTVVEDALTLEQAELKLGIREPLWPTEVYDLCSRVNSNYTVKQPKTVLHIDNLVAVPTIAIR